MLGKAAGQAWEAAAGLRGGHPKWGFGGRRQVTCLLPTEWKPYGRPWDTRTLAGRVCRNPGWKGMGQVFGAEKETSLAGDVCGAVLSAGGVCGIKLWGGDVCGVKVLTGAVCGLMLMEMLLTGRMQEH